jgi:integrase
MKIRCCWTKTCSCETRFTFGTSSQLSPDRPEVIVIGSGYDVPQRPRRQVELSQGAVEALRRHRTAAMEAALAAGRSFDREGFVSARVDDRSLSVTTLWKRWHRLQGLAGIVHPVMFHDARHTAATLLLGQGVHPKVVSDMLGHSTIAITLDTYSHVTPAMHREAARVMDQLFSQ